MISDVSYLDDGRRRPSCTEPHQRDRRALQRHQHDFYFRNVFDAGEYDLGSVTLALGCDCLGEIRYLDAVLADESGSPETINNAICMHEEDYGILWKHWNFRYDETPRYAGRDGWWSRPSTRSATMSTASSGTSTRTDHPVRGQADRHRADRVRSRPEPLRSSAPSSHRSSTHRTISTCSTCDSTSRSTAPTTPSSKLTPSGSRWDRATSTETPSWPAISTITNERDGAVAAIHRRHAPGRSSTPECSNRFGEPVGYKLVPAVGPTLLAGPGSDLARRAEFARTALWVTAYDPHGAACSRRLPQPACRRRHRRVGQEGARPRQHRHRPVAHVRHLAYPAPRGLANHALRVHRLLSQTRGVLRPQSITRRPTTSGTRHGALSPGTSRRILITGQGCRCRD